MTGNQTPYAPSLVWLVLSGGRIYIVWDLEIKIIGTFSINLLFVLTIEKFLIQLLEYSNIQLGIYMYMHCFYIVHCDCTKQVHVYAM